MLDSWSKSCAFCADNTGGWFRAETHHQEYVLINDVSFKTELLSD